MFGLNLAKGLHNESEEDRVDIHVWTRPSTPTVISGASDKGANKSFAVRCDLTGVQGKCIKGPVHMGGEH